MMIAPGIEAANELFRFLRLLAFLFFSLELILLDPILDPVVLLAIEIVRTIRQRISVLCVVRIFETIGDILRTASSKGTNKGTNKGKRKRA